jgi:hypothetical protein
MLHCTHKPDTAKIKYKLQTITVAVAQAEMRNTVCDGQAHPSA